MVTIRELLDLDLLAIFFETIELLNLLPMVFGGGGDGAEGAEFDFTGSNKEMLFTFFDEPDKFYLSFHKFLSFLSIRLKYAPWHLFQIVFCS